MWSRLGLWIALLSGAVLPCAALAEEVMVPIRYRDSFDASVTGTVPISVRRGPNGCEYRLEYNELERVTSWALGEVAGDRGPAQRYFNATCTPPAFTASSGESEAQFDEQTAYYWVKQARDYAVRRLWTQPRGWTGGAFKVASTAVRIDVLTSGAWNLACLPLPTRLTGCMRAHAFEGPILHVKAGFLSPRLLAHEYGHYNSFIFGHASTTDPATYNDPTQCAMRSFQETIADLFAVLVLHDARQRVLSNNSGAQWTNTCGADGDDGVMGTPLVEAFEEATRGGFSLKVNWTTADQGNEAMASALSHALASTPSHRIDALAYAMLRWLNANEPQRAPEVTAIFRFHRLAPMPLSADCSAHEGCASGHCDAGWGTSHTNTCVPGPGTGATRDHCTNDNQCRSLNCDGLTQVGGGGWSPGACADKVALGATCSQHGQCLSGYCDAGWGTSQTSICVPAPGTGAGGQPCSKHAHCQSGTCQGVVANGTGGWRPGSCSFQKALRASCANHGDCISGYCDAGWGTSQTNTCMPNGNGTRGQPCTQHKQCASQICSGVFASGNTWMPGTCS